MAKTYFFWDDLEDNVIEEYDEAGSTVADYTTEPDDFGNVISQRRGGQSSFFHYDAVGSTLAVTDENQNGTDTRAYSAFGETTDRTGSTSFSFQYVGQKQYYRDSVTEQYLARRRSYQPAIARWISVDPLDSYRLMLMQTYYTYVLNDAPNEVDPSGLQSSKSNSIQATVAPVPSVQELDWLNFGPCNYSDKGHRKLAGRKEQVFEKVVATRSIPCSGWGPAATFGENCPSDVKLRGAC